MSNVTKISAAALIAAASLMTAATANTCAGNFTGFYLGASAGVASTNAKSEFSGDKVTLTIPQVGDQTLNARSSKADNGKTAAIGALLAGYNYQFNPMGVVGIEMQGGFDTTKINLINEEGTFTDLNPIRADLKRNYFVNLTAKLGALFTPSTMAFIKAGIETGKWRLNVNPINASGVAQAKSKSGISPIIGAGVTTLLNKNVMVTLDYTATFGPKMSINDIKTGSNDGIQYTEAGATNKINYRVKSLIQHKIQVGVAYKF